MTLEARLAQLFAVMREYSLLVVVIEGDFDSARQLAEQRVRSRFRESDQQWNRADDEKFESAQQHASSGLTLLRLKAAS